MTNPVPIKITDLDPLNSLSNEDILLVVDKSDTTQSADGTTKNLTAIKIKNYIFSGFNIGSIDTHTDVQITNPDGNDLLRYNETSGKWENFTPNYVTPESINLDNVVRDTDFTSTGLIKRGATVGSYSVITDNSTNWNTAHGWGNHANAGYLTSAGLGNISINALSDVDTVSNNPTNGQVLTWTQPNPGASGKWVPLSIASNGGEVTLSSFSVGLEPAANGNGQLSYNSNSGIFTYTPPDLSTYLTSTNLDVALNNESINALNDVNTQTNPPSNGDLLSWNSSSNSWVPISAPVPQTGLQGRSSRSGTLNSLVANNTAIAGQLDITNVAKTYALLKIQTSHAAWVTLYVSDAARDADALRTETTNPLPGSGVIAEIITSGATTRIITPGTLGWNNDSTPTSTVYAKVVNKSGATNNITVILTYVALEA